MTVRLGAQVATLSLILTAALTAVVTSPSTAAPRVDGPTQLVTLALGADGELDVLAAEPADVELPAAATARAAAGRLVVEVLDRAGRPTYRRTVEVEQEIRAELPVEGSDEPTGLTAPKDTVTFTVALPAGASVRVSDGGETSEAARLRAPAGRAAGDVELVRLPGYPLVESTNRLDVVILGDGYTAADRDAFKADAKRIADGTFDITPYDEYSRLFNVVGVFAPSAQRGADHPAYLPVAPGGTTHPILGCPDVSAPAIGSYADTRYDSSYCYYGIQRLMVPIDEGQVYADASAAYPGWDQILMVVNDTEYGGSGGAIATSSLDPSGIEVLKHELGHSLLRLDDEYTTETPGYPPCSDYGRNGIAEPCAANVTDVTKRADLKWKRWVKGSTPIPTSSPKPPGLVGLFLGAHYSSDTWYRPCDACLMQYLSTPFGAVAAEQLPVRLYTGGWQGPAGDPGARLELIEPGTARPAASSVVVAPTSAKRFAVQVVGPRGAHTRVVWSVNGKVVKRTTVPSGTVARYRLDGARTTRRLTVRATDVAGILHPSLARISASKRVWEVRPR